MWKYSWVQLMFSILLRGRYNPASRLQIALLQLRKKKMQSMPPLTQQTDRIWIQCRFDLMCLVSTLLNPNGFDQMENQQRSALMFQGVFNFIRLQSLLHGVNFWTPSDPHDVDLSSTPLGWWSLWWTAGLTFYTHGSSWSTITCGWKWNFFRHRYPNNSKACRFPMRNL